MSNRVWIWSYQLEECRENAAAHRRFWREALACVGLGLLRIVGQV